MKKYEAPRAVRLADTATGEFECAIGTLGNVNFCKPTGAIPDVNLCSAGSSVQKTF